MLGYTRSELEPLCFKTWSDKIHPIDLLKAEKALENHFNGGSDVYEIEFQLKHKLGHYMWVLASGKVVEWDGNKQAKRMIGMHLDITERKRNEHTLKVTGQLLNQSQRVARVGGWELDLTSGNLFWTDETYRLHDTTPEKFNPTVDAGVGFFLPDSQVTSTKALDEAINHGIGYDLELETYTTKGKKIDVRTTCIVTQEAGVVVRLTGIFQDISDQKNIQRKLELTNSNLAKVNEALKKSAHYYSLTGLPNRYLLADRMQQAILKSVRDNKYLAIAFMDIDCFKEINDNHGHDIGDKLLKKIASEVKVALRKGDPDHLLRHADQAMYIAKQKGKNRYHTFDIEHDVAIKHLNEKLSHIAQALTKREFVLYYQPKVDLRNNNVVGAEAFIRWEHPDKGLLACSGNVLARS